MATSRADLSAARQACKQACRDNDAASAATHLLRWAALEWPDAAPRSLSEIRRRVSNDQRPIVALEQALYAGGEGEGVWDGSALWDALAGGLTVAKTPAATPSASGLAPLYPSPG